MTSWHGKTEVLNGKEFENVVSRTEIPEHSFFSEFYFSFDSEFVGFCDKDNELFTLKEIVKKVNRRMDFTIRMFLFKAIIPNIFSNCPAIPEFLNQKFL